MFETRRTSTAVVPSLIAALAWGAMFPIASVALEHVDPFVLTAIRYGVAVVIFLILLRVIEGRSALRTEGRARELFILGSLGFAGFNLLSYVGLEHTHPQNAALIVALQPLVTAVGAVDHDPPPAQPAHVHRDGRRAARRDARDHARQARHAAARRGPPRRTAGADRLRLVDRVHARRAPLRRLLAAALHGAERHLRHDHDLRRHRDRARHRLGARPVARPTSAPPGGTRSTSSPPAP